MSTDRAPAAGASPVKSAKRALQVLETLAESDGYCSLGELGRILQIPKSSLHAILHTMEGREWVVADDLGRGYSLGVQSLHVGGSYLERDEDINRIRRVLDWLAERTGETVHLGRLHGADIVYLAKRESVHPLRMFSAVGRRLPAHATALGKAVLAEREQGAELRGVLEGPLRQVTESTIIDPAELRADLEKTRRQGFAVDNEESTEGVRCFAVALKAGESSADNGISFTIPVTRLSKQREDELIRLLFQARQEVGRELESWSL